MIASGTLKLSWEELPSKVRDEIERVLGGKVISAQTLTGGFSPGVAARVETAEGGKAFIKSASHAVSPFAAEANRREIKHTLALQDNPRIPRLLHSFEHEGWVTLIYELVEGTHPSLPWKKEELEFVLSELDKLSADLTPCPRPELFDPIEMADQELFNGWRSFSRDPSKAEELENKWVENNLGVLVRLEQSWGESARGVSLVHMDLRADQILVTKAGAVFLDWPHAKIGAPWVDLLFMLPSITLQGGPSMEELVQKTSLAQVSEPKLYYVGAALAGFFLWNGLQPPPPKMVTLRRFQRDQGEIVIAWLERNSAKFTDLRD